MWVRGTPTQRTRARRTTFPATIRQTYKSDGGTNYPWSGMQRHDHRKDAGPRHRKAPGRHEFRGPGRGPHGHELLRIPDRDHRQRDPAGGPELFYSLHDAGLLQTFWETVPLLDGRNWRIFYWALNERDVDRILADEEASPTEPW